MYVVVFFTYDNTDNTGAKVAQDILCFMWESLFCFCWYSGEMILTLLFQIKHLTNWSNDLFTWTSLCDCCPGQRSGSLICSVTSECLFSALMRCVASPLIQQVQGVCFHWDSSRKFSSASVLEKKNLLLTSLCSFSSESPAPELPVGASSRRARPVDVTGGCGGETEDGGLWSGCWDPFDRQPDVYLSCGALWRLHSSELEGGRAAEEPELQRVLQDLPHCCQELPEGSFLQTAVILKNIDFHVHGVYTSSFLSNKVRHTLELKHLDD